MGRKRNIFIREFFEFDRQTQVSKCKVCGLQLAGQVVTNLKRHMVTAHFAIYEKERVDIDGPSVNEDDKKMKITVELSKNDVKDVCLDFLTKQSQPLAFFDSDPFKKLTDQIFQGLNMGPINSRNIISLLNDRCVEIKNIIKKTIKGRMVSLKMDSATRHNRSVLGINLQLVVGKELIVYTLAMREMSERLTAENLKTNLEEVLLEFDISRKQIYSVTTDNGSNMIKAVDMLGDDDDHSADETDDEDNDGIMHDLYQDTAIVSIKCAAHTIQLAVKDFLAANSFAVISRARGIVKAMRTPNSRKALQALNLGMPVLDVPTRWCSTYEMLERLLTHRRFCTEHLNDSLTEDEWKAAEDLVGVLNPTYSTMLQLQQEQLLMGDFYRIWLTLKVRVSAQDSPMAVSLCSCIEKREMQLLNTPAMNAALYVDPRLRRLLTSAKKEMAKQHLKGLVAKWMDLQESHEDVTNAVNCLDQEGSSTSHSFLHDESTNQSVTSLLRETIRGLEVDSDDERTAERTPELTKAYADIDSYYEQRVDITTDLMEYWEPKKYELRYLWELARIVHAAPATQVTVERAFSALRIVLNDLRCNLLEENLRAIMFVKLNNNILRN